MGREGFKRKNDGGAKRDVERYAEIIDAFNKVGSIAATCRACRCASSTVYRAFEWAKEEGAEVVGQAVGRSWSQKSGKSPKELMESYREWTDVRINALPIELTSKTDYATLLGLGDLHWGAQGTDVEKFERNLEWWRAHNQDLGGSGCGILFAGDVFDMVTAMSVGNRMSPFTFDELLKMLCYTLEPVVNDGMIVGIGDGSHDQRNVRPLKFGMSAANILANELDVPYLGFACFARLSVSSSDSKSQQEYTLYYNHGSSGARTPQGRRRALQYMMENHECDITVMGHLHHPESASEGRFIMPGGLEVETKFRYGLITPSFKRMMPGEWDWSKGFTPAGQGLGVINLGVHHWAVHIEF